MRRDSCRLILTTTFCVALLSGAITASAGSIVGGSALLSASDQLQLETWLGAGSLKLTNVFSKSLGDGKTPYDFHSAVDGKGATFTVVEVVEANGYAQQIIGGYNPQSWSSSGQWNFTIDDADKTAFLFNLKNDDYFGQKLDGDVFGDGSYQTLNRPDYGPVFGSGDLYLTGLEFGIASQVSYGDPNTSDDGKLVGKTYFPEYLPLVIGSIEVFTIEPAAATAVPEPSSLALLGLGCLSIGVGAVRRRKRTNSSGKLESNRASTL